MKYQIKCDNNILYDLREDEFTLENPVLNLEINKTGNLTFTIYPDHPYFDRIYKLSSVITVLKDNTVIFKGRVISDEQGIYNSKNIECEGILGYLNDSIVRPYTFSGTPAEHFTALINNHNSQVTNAQKFNIGTITVTDPNNYISRSSINYANTWKVLNEDLIDKLGGYLKVRYENDGTYIDYLSDFSDTSTQVIEFGENLIDVLVKNDAAQVYSVVIPLGAEIETENETKERLTIESVNSGLDYLVNQTALNNYGWIVAPVEDTTWDNVTTAAALKSKGTTYLNNNAVMLKNTFECKALDLNLTDDQIESFFIYEYVRFKSTIHNINEIFLLEKISIPIASPQNMSITLGEETTSLTGIELGNKKNIDNVITRVGVAENNIESTIEKVNAIDTDIDNVREEMITNMTSIQNNQEQILMTALEDYVAKDNFETYQQTVSTQFEQTARDFNFNFNNITSTITNLNGTTQQQFQEISKYIRFVDGNIVLGEVGNEITLTIENDRISFKQNNNEVAYLSNNKLVVLDGEFLYSLTIGNFKWVPRANGNLSLVKIGGV